MTLPYFGYHESQCPAGAGSSGNWSTTDFTVDKSPAGSRSLHEGGATMEHQFLVGAASEGNWSSADTGSSGAGSSENWSISDHNQSLAGSPAIRTGVTACQQVLYVHL